MERGSWFFQLLVDSLTCITCLDIRVNGCSHVAPVVPVWGVGKTLKSKMKCNHTNNILSFEREVNIYMISTG